MTVPRCLLSPLVLAAGALAGVTLAGAAGGRLLAGPLDLSASTSRVGRYGMVEFRVPAVEEYSNPYAPDVVRLEVLVETPGGKTLEIPGFFCREYEHRRVDGGGSRPRAEWLYPRAALFKARFAPAAAGRYTATAVLQAGGRTARSAAVTLECVPSKSRGFVRLNPRDRRFFQFSEGAPFFAIGQNLAFVGEGQYVTVKRAEEIFRKLAENGANYVRVWTCSKDWALAIEARKSAWGRSWGPEARVVRLPDGAGGAKRRCVELRGGKTFTQQVAPCHPVAVRRGTDYTLSGRVRTDGKGTVRLAVGSAPGVEIAPRGAPRPWKRFEMRFTTGPRQDFLGRTRFEVEGGGTVWIDTLSLREAGGGPELLWEADVNRPVPGTYNQVDSWMLDRVVRAAESSGVYLQLCLLTRDLYMDRLKDDRSAEYSRSIRHACHFMRYVVARWGYSTSIVTWEYFNEMNPSLPTRRFYEEVGRYVRNIDVYGHLLATSNWHPTPRDWALPCLDVADEHFYLRPAGRSSPRDEVDAVLERARLLRRHAASRPALISEFGLATARWGLSPRMKRDLRLVHVHNALWASALSGLSGTVLFWWWEELDRSDAYGQYRPLADFLQDVPFGKVALKSSVERLPTGGILRVGLEASRGADYWIFQPEAAWVGSVEKGVAPGEVHSLTFPVKGLEPGKYRVQWWDTRGGGVLREDRATASREGLGLAAPAFSRDIACKIRREAR